MFELVHNDPRGWLLNFFKAHQMPPRAPAGTGYVYVLAITGAVSYVKVGSTAQPRGRLEALRSEAHRLGGAVTRAWLSPAHPTYKATEAQALTKCRTISPSSSPRSEYFPGLGFVAARQEAMKAVMGFRDCPQVTTTTAAAGMHQPMPTHVERRMAPDVWDLWRQERRPFRQGSARSRFRRRNSAHARPDHVPESLLTSAFASLFQPSAQVIPLVRRK